MWVEGFLSAVLLPAFAPFIRMNIFGSLIIPVMRIVLDHVHPSYIYQSFLLFVISLFGMHLIGINCKIIPVAKETESW